VIYSPPTQNLLGSGISAPSGVAVDGNGNIFVSDYVSNGVKEILASNGSTITLGTFIEGDDVSVDGSGNVFVINNRTTLSEMLAVNGSVPASPTIRTLYTAFDALNGMKVDGNGNVFLANSFNGGGSSAVYEIPSVNGSIPASPTILTLSSSFGGPTGVAIDASGDVFVSDEGNNAIYEMLAVNGSIPASPAVRTLGSGFSEPTNVAIDANGNVFVPDYGNHAVKEMVAVNGSIPASNPTILTLGTNFIMPAGLIVDESGNVFVADEGFTQAIKIDYSDPPSLTFATTRVGSTSSDSPQTVTMMNDGNASLIFATTIPSGNNPSITAGFTIGSSSTCLSLASGSPVSVLSAGATCTDVISFTPVAPGPDSGKLITTDDNLNIGNATQTVLLYGIGTLISPTIVFTVPNHTVGDPPFTVAATSNSPGAITYTVVSGPATISGSTVTLTGAGTVTLQASQAATGTYASGTQDATFTVAKEPQTITFAQPASPVTYGVAPITLSASASSGLAVTFSVLSGPATVSGNVLTITGVGTVVVAADQPGNTTYAAAPEVTHSITVYAGPATVAVTANPSPVFLLNPVTLTATVSSPAALPTGSVIFYDGTNPIGTAVLSGGVAALSVSTLTLGSHSITATYSGDINFPMGTSSAATVVVMDFSVNMGSAQTISHGGEATYSLTLAPVGGAMMPSAISFTVTGAPYTSAITFSPQQLPAGSGQATVTLSIQTPDYPVGPWNVSRSQTRGSFALALIVAGGLLLPFGRRRRIPVLLLVLLMAAITLTGCGSGWKTQQFAITVTASSGPLSHTATAALTSQ